MVKNGPPRLRELAHMARGSIGLKSRNLGPTFLTLDLGSWCLTLQKKPDWVLGAEKDGEKVEKAADDVNDASAAAAAPDASADANTDNGGDNQPAAEAEPQVWFSQPLSRFLTPLAIVLCLNLT